MASKYCKKTASCKNADWCATDKDFGENCEWYDEITNFYKIQHMTMDELAEWMEWHDYCPDPLPHAPCIGPDGEPKDEYDCYQCCLDWLRQEADNG